MKIQNNQSNKMISTFMHLDYHKSYIKIFHKIALHVILVSAYHDNNVIELLEKNIISIL